MTLEEMISAVQEKLRISVDGRAGPETWAAIYKKIVAPASTTQTLTQGIDETDQRSEAVIAKLHPVVQPIARALVRKSALNGVKIKIISGLRTYAEQDALYAKGRTAPGTIVTRARGGYSNHNFGIAFDIGVFEGAQYLTDSPKYKAVGMLGMELGLEWGGNWKTIIDQPHYQLRPAWAGDLTESRMLAELRTRVAGGRDIFT